MGREPNAVPLGGALGFVALVIAAGLWVLRTRQDAKEMGEEGADERRASVAENARFLSVADVSDDEDDDLWEHIASMLEARRRSGTRSKKDIESDDEVWRIIAQIVSARGLLHRHFQSPDRTSTASVKELRRWFESQAAEKAARASSEYVGGAGSRQTRVTVKDTGHQAERDGVESNGVGRGLLEEEGPSEKARKIDFSDGESSEEEDLEWEAIKARALQLAKPDGKAISDGKTRSDGKAVSDGKVDSNGKAGSDGKKTGSIAPSQSSEQEAAGGKSPKVASEASPVDAKPITSALETSGGVVKKIVRRQKSPPAERENDALDKIEAEGGQASASQKIVRRQKSPPEEREHDALERLNAEGGSVSATNGGGIETTKAREETGSNGKAKAEEVRKEANGSSVSGGSEYQGPPGGEDRVVVYLTSVRAVRKTFEQCATVRHIFHGFSVAVDERDISIHLPYRQELKDLLGGRAASVPQVFIRGKHIGGLQEVQYLTDEKKMQELLVGMPRIKVTEECEGCGGGKFLPCVDCRGSQKVLVGDKMEACTACNEYGLIRCPMCS